MKMISIIFYPALLVVIGCLPVFAQLSDPDATVQTKNLYRNLTGIAGQEVLFGHQDDLAYGVGWKYQKGRSDIKSLTGEYPAVFGWDVSGLEQDKSLNLDGVPFAKMREYIRMAYDSGAVNTLSWHMNNPADGKTSWDTSSVAVRSALPNGAKHGLYKGWLDKFAVFVKSLKGSDGQAIPVLFRPFHENGGAWFWWGTKSCTPEEYKALWRFTVDYLQRKKGLHNLIYVYNTCDFSTEQQYLERYPGNRFVDVLSFDYYQYGKENGRKYVQDVSRSLGIQHALAKRSGKLSALAETGFSAIPVPDWWTTVFAEAIRNYKPSYVLVWRNAGYREKEQDDHYYAAYPGQVSASDFLKLIKEKKVLLQKGIQRYQIYK